MRDLRRISIDNSRHYSLDGISMSKIRLNSWRTSLSWKSFLTTSTSILAKLPLPVWGPMQSIADAYHSRTFWLRVNSTPTTRHMRSFWRNLQTERYLVETTSTLLCSISWWLLSLQSISNVQTQIALVVGGDFGERESILRLSSLSIPPLHTGSCSTTRTITKAVWWFPMRLLKTMSSFTSPLELGFTFGSYRGKGFHWKML